jgi:hypothetical protein
MCKRRKHALAYAVERSEEIDVQGLLPPIDVALGDRTDGTEDASIQDNGFKAASSTNSRLHGILVRLALRYVALHDMEPRTALRGKFFQLPGL